MAGSLRGTFTLRHGLNHRRALSPSLAGHTRTLLLIFRFVRDRVHEALDRLHHLTRQARRIGVFPAERRITAQYPRGWITPTPRRKKIVRHTSKSDHHPLQIWPASARKSASSGYFAGFDDVSDTDAATTESSSTGLKLANMGSGKPKQFVRPPPKKKPAKAAALESADDFQEAADYEEAAGGKHRGGDPVKSGRAFVRALEIYDKGLAKHPNSFDLAYNKARLQLELSQHENVIEHIGVPIVDWLQLTLESHRHALRLSEENPDVLFNTAQVLATLAEHLSEDDAKSEAVPALQEALELLSSCLSRQEMMYEQHRLDFPDTEDGGVALDEPEPQKQPSSVEDTDMGEQSAIVETPVGPSDLLDTVHASLSALTTLVPLADEAALQNLGEMARQLTESKAPDYIRLLPEEEQDKARFSVAIDRATFIASYASAQFEHHMIELETYVERLDTFDIPGKEQNVDALVAEAEARTELVLSMIDRFGEATNIPAALCWKHLTACQDLLSKAAKLNDEEAQKSKAEIYQSKGDTELLRHRIIHIPKTDLADSTRNSAPTLIQNAQTFYKGAVGHAKASGDEDVEGEAQQRWNVAKAIAALLYGGESLDKSAEGTLMEALEECVEEGLISEDLAQAIISGESASRS